jgi:hypothetical protein
VAIFLQAIKAYCDKQCQGASNTNKMDFTDPGNKAIANHIWKCFVPLSKMGKNNRNLNTLEVSNLLQNVKHIEDTHLIAHYKKLPHDYLENTFITIVIANYENDQVTELLQKSLYLESIWKSSSKNGCVNAQGLETKFKKALKKGEKITDFIDRSGKHPYVTSLGINTRTLNSFGGGKNEKK